MVIFYLNGDYEGEFSCSPSMVILRVNDSTSMEMVRVEARAYLDGNDEGSTSMVMTRVNSAAVPQW